MVERRRWKYYLNILVLQLIVEFSCKMNMLDNDTFYFLQAVDNLVCIIALYFIEYIYGLDSV